MQQSGPAHFIRAELPQNFVCEISCAGGVGVNGHIESPDQCLARGSGKAHVRVKTHKQDTLGAYGTQPLLQACPSERAINIFFKTLLGTETKFGTKSWRRLRAPSPRNKRAGFCRLVVMDDPSDGLAELPGLLNSEVNVLECVRVIRDGS
jgi:hypothetical protein